MEIVLMGSQPRTKPHHPFPSGSELQVLMQCIWLCLAPLPLTVKPHPSNETFSVIWVTPHTMSTHRLAAAQLWISENSHSEQLPPACYHCPELSESRAGGRWSLKKAFQMPASIQHSKCCVMGESQPSLSPWLQAQGSGGYRWESSERWSIILLWFSFDQRWCAHYDRGASGTEGEISPPRDATRLPKS